MTGQSRGIELRHGAATDVGLVRQVNEDAFLAAPPVFVVADGMGGHASGDVASAIVVEEFGRLADAGYDPRRGADVVAETLGVCQDRIAEFGAAHRPRGGSAFYAGTTAVVALLGEDDEGPRWVLANLGDSRISCKAGGRREQVSVDHSLVQELVDSGRISPDEAATHPERHVITRALGGPDRAEADYFLLPLPAVDRLVLCSDGITGMIDDARMAEILGSASDPHDAAEELVAAAVGAGGRDNATAVVVDVVGLTAEDGHDSEHQRVSLDQDLGALR